MTNHQYSLEPERQADLSRSTSTPSIKAGDPPRKDKVCLQLVKTNIVISYNIYDFDWYVQVTSAVCLKSQQQGILNKKDANFTAEDVEDLIKIILACSKSAKLFPAWDLL